MLKQRRIEEHLSPLSPPPIGYSDVGFVTHISYDGRPLVVGRHPSPNCLLSEGGVTLTLPNPIIIGKAIWDDPLDAEFILDDGDSDTFGSFVAHMRRL